MSNGTDLTYSVYKPFIVGEEVRRHIIINMILTNSFAFSNALKKIGMSIFAAVFICIALLGIFRHLTATDPSNAIIPPILIPATISIISVIQIKAYGEAEVETKGTSVGEAFRTLKFITEISLILLIAYLLLPIFGELKSTLFLIISCLYGLWSKGAFIVTFLKCNLLATKTNIKSFRLLVVSFKLIFWAIAVGVITGLSFGIATSTDSTVFILIGAIGYIAVSIMLIISLIKYIRGWMRASEEVLNGVVIISEE